MSSLLAEILADAEYYEESEFDDAYEVFDEFDDQRLNNLEIVPPSDSRKRITSTTHIPFRWICSIIPTFRHPTTGDPIEMTRQPGSGFLIGPRHILTAAHNLFPTEGPLKDQSPIRVKVTPGHNDGSESYGHYVSTVYKVRSEWRSGGKNTHNPSYDFAMFTPEAEAQIRAWLT